MSDLHFAFGHDNILVKFLNIINEYEFNKIYIWAHIHVNQMTQQVSQHVFL
jgi:F0F1-type ATP synthase gamma subunit